MNDRPIDKVRNSGLSMTLPADTGGITHMGEINGALHMIGGSAIYRVQLADEIDPERTNIAIPNTHQKVLSYGTDFPYVRQTLMTARRLFSNNVLGPAFDYKAPSAPSGYRRAITIPGARHRIPLIIRNETSYAQLGQGTR